MYNFFGEKRIVQRKNFLQLASVHGISKLRDRVTTTGSGSITDVSSGEYRLRTGGANSSARLSTAERIPYGPGTEVEPGTGARLSRVPQTGETVRLGHYDDDNGFILEFTDEGLNHVIRRRGEETRYLWGRWNGEAITKTGLKRGIPGSTIRPLDGYIYIDPFAWYGWGPWESRIQRHASYRSGRAGSWIDTLFSWSPTGKTSIATPHVFMRQEVISDADGGDLSVYVAGRQISVLGDYDPPRRPTNISVDGTTVAVAADTANTWTGIAAIRRRMGEEYAITRILSLTGISDADIEIAVAVNPTVPNSGNWTGGITHLDSAETHLEENRNPGDIDLTTADFVQKSRVRGGEKNKTTGGGNLPLIDLPLIENEPHVICARAVSTEADVDITAEWGERY